MALHSWWGSFGQIVGAADALTSESARALAEAIARSKVPGATLIEFRQDESREAVCVEIDVERPQDLAYPIRATEPLGFMFSRVAEEQPHVLALRPDFPDTPHQNWTPKDAPCSLCVDDRPWAEAKLTSTPPDLVRRAQLWLAKAARGDLHDPAQPLDPLFFQSGLSLVVPASVFAVTAMEPAELLGFVRHDNSNTILTLRAALGKVNSQEARFIVLPFQAAPQSMARLRHAPTTLEELRAELERCGIDLLKELKARVTAWAGMKEDNLRRLNSRLIFLVAFPIKEGEDRSANDLRAFVMSDTAGEMAVALGILLKHSTQVGARDAYFIAIGDGQSISTTQIRIEPAEVHFALNRELAASVAGREPDRRTAVLVGAGSLGSQLAIDLAREGALSWTIVDQDYLMPHNLARHALLAGDTGAPKAFALARQMEMLLDEPVNAEHCDVTRLDASAPVLDSFAKAEIIIDASASVAVSRVLDDMSNVGRRLCTFFNPVGNAVVVIAESSDRSISLRDLEAQYHDLLLSTRELAGHLKSDQPGLRYSGSCRAVTNRIPATRAALLSAVAARGISACLDADESVICIWTTSEEGEVHRVQRVGSPVTRIQLGSWSMTYDERLIQTMREHRAKHLPNETGGVLFGIVDVSRRSIHVAHAMPQPEDSRNSSAGFERGVVGLLDLATDVAKNSLYQLRYVGEWHSHPIGSSVRPSDVDIEQLAWLGSELDAGGVPALMAIAGDDGAFCFSIHDDRQEVGQPVLKRTGSKS